MKKPTTPIAEHYKELKTLIVKRSAEKTEEYNARIRELKEMIDFFEYGCIKTKI